MFRLKSIRQTVVFVNIIIVLPLVVIFFIALSLMFTESTLGLNRSKLDTMEDKRKNALMIVGETIKISDSFLMDMKMNSLMSKISKKTSSHDYQYIAAQRAFQEKMREITGMYSERQYRMLMLCPNNISFCQSSVPDGTAGLVLDNLKREAWYKEMTDNSGQIYFLPKYRSAVLESLFPDDIIFAVREMKNLSSGRVIAVLITALSEEMWQRDVSGLQSDGNNSLLTDRHGKVIFASDREIYGQNLERNSYYDKITDYGKGFFPGNVGGAHSLIHFINIPEGGWTLIEYGPFQYKLSSYVTLLIFLGAALLLVIVLMVRYNCNFIIVRLEEEEREKYTLEMQALEAQINPHFLYNTIASIRFMNSMDEHEHTDEALLAFSKLLRRSFADRRVLIPVSEEMDFAGEYVRLMRIRRENAFEYEAKISDEAAGLGILKNTIQPLVENSIFHGFNSKESTGHIYTEAYVREGLLYISVSDDGEGADIEKVRAQLENKTAPGLNTSLNGIGINNVQMRIIRRFGPDFGLSAEKNERGGLRITIKLPRIAL